MKHNESINGDALVVKSPGAGAQHRKLDLKITAGSPAAEIPHATSLIALYQSD
jgi:hypothetical protein